MKQLTSFDQIVGKRCIATMLGDAERILLFEDREYAILAPGDDLEYDPVALLDNYPSSLVRRKLGTDRENVRYKLNATGEWLRKHAELGKNDVAEILAAMETWHAGIEERQKQRRQQHYKALKKELGDE